MSHEPVTVRVDSAEGKIVGRLDPGVSDRLHRALSYVDPQAEFLRAMRAMNQGKQAQRAAWGRRASDDSLISLWRRPLRTFPAGLLPRVLQVLSDRKVPYTVQDCRPLLVARNQQIVFPDPNPDYAVREYQGTAVVRMLNMRSCMAQIATGGGKTIIAGHLMSMVSAKTCFLVHTRDLLYQATDVFADMFGKEYVGQAGDGVVDFRPITVATLQTMARALGITVQHNDWLEEEDRWDDPGSTLSKARAISYANSVGLLFADECHRVAAQTASEVVQSFPNTVHRYGLSASPWRDDNADIVLEGCFGEVGPKVTASELVDLGYLVEPYIRMLAVDPVEYPEDARYDQVYDDYIVANEDRNRRVVEAACSMVRRGRPTMVLVRRIVHGELLSEWLADELGFGVPFLSGEDDALVRKAVIDDIRAGRPSCVVATTIADEGLDIKPLSGLVLAGGGKSSTRALQRIGRVLRPYPGKRDAEVVDFDDNAKFLSRHSAARERLYRTESRFTILDR